MTVDISVSDSNQTKPDGGPNPETAQDQISSPDRAQEGSQHDEGKDDHHHGQEDEKGICRINDAQRGDDLMWNAHMLNLGCQRYIIHSCASYPEQSEMIFKTT